MPKCTFMFSACHSLIFAVCQIMSRAFGSLLHPRNVSDMVYEKRFRLLHFARSEHFVYVISCFFREREESYENSNNGHAWRAGTWHVIILDKKKNMNSWPFAYKAEFVFVKSHQNRPSVTLERDFPPFFLTRHTHRSGRERSLTSSRLRQPLSFTRVPREMPCDLSRNDISLILKKIQFKSAIWRWRIDGEYVFFCIGKLLSTSWMRVSVSRLNTDMGIMKR